METRNGQALMMYNSEPYRRIRYGLLSTICIILLGAGHYLSPGGGGKKVGGSLLFWLMKQGGGGGS